MNIAMHNQDLERLALSEVPATPPPEVLRFAGVALSYRRAGPVVWVPDFSLRQTEALALLGRNGAGKTTIMRAAVGNLRAKAGAVEVFGSPVARLSRWDQSRLYHVIELESNYDFLSLQQLFELHAQLYPHWREPLAAEFATRAEIPRRQIVATMSRGQKLKARLACALGTQPLLLILDEPFESVDAVSRSLIRESLLSWRQAGGGSLLYSSHRDADVEGLAARTLTVD